MNGTVIPGATLSTFTRAFAEDGSVTCRVTGTAPCGLPSFNTVFIDVDANAPVGVGNMAMTEQLFTLAPNPSRGQFIITGPGSDDMVAAVTNMLGQVVYRVAFAPTQGVLRAEVSLPPDLPAGNYLVTITVGGKRQVSRFTLNR